MTCTLLYILNLTFSPLLISCQNTGERLHCFQGECWFEIASSCFGEFPGCFEVCTPLSVLTLTQRAMAAAIYTSCGRIGFPHVTDYFLTFFCEAIPRIQPAHWNECRNGAIIDRRTKHVVLTDHHTSWCLMLLFFAFVENKCNFSDFHVGKYQGHSQSPNQCISYNSHNLLILPLKFMLLFSGTPYCGPHCLPHRRVTMTQECWARCRVIPSNATPFPKATSIATIGQSA